MKKGKSSNAKIKNPILIALVGVVIFIGVIIFVLVNYFPSGIPVQEIKNFKLAGISGNVISNTGSRLEVFNCQEGFSGYVPPGLGEVYLDLWDVEGRHRFISLGSSGGDFRVSMEEIYNNEEYGNNENPGFIHEWMWVGLKAPMDYIDLGSCPSGIENCYQENGGYWFEDSPSTCNLEIPTGETKITRVDCATGFSGSVAEGGLSLDIWDGYGNNKKIELNEIGDFNIPSSSLPGVGSDFGGEWLWVGLKRQEGSYFDLGGCPASGIENCTGESGGYWFTTDYELCNEAPVQGVCGDGVVDSGEICDSNNLNGRTCENLGYDGGSLSCLEDCSGFDTSLCRGTLVEGCGDGYLDLNVGEVCEYGLDGIPGTGDDVLNGATCQSLGYDFGSLKCSANCYSFDEGGCFNLSSIEIDRGDLLLHYTFESFGNARDVCGLLSSDGIDEVEGVVGSGLKLDGGYVELQEPEEFNFQENDYSIAFWVKAPLEGDLNSGIITKNSSYDNPNGGFGFFKKDSREIEFKDRQAALSTGNLEEEWNHIIYVRENGFSTLYVNGEVKSTSGGLAEINNVGKVLIGSHDFLGTIDELYIYKKALNASEGADIYEKGKQEEKACTVDSNCPEIIIESLGCEGDYIKASGIEYYCEKEVDENGEEISPYGICAQNRTSALAPEPCEFGCSEGVCVFYAN